MSETARKQSKLERLTEELAAAKEALAQATARLQPAIDAERARVDELERVYRKAEKAARRAYETFLAEERAARSRLFPHGASEQLMSAIRAKVAAQYPEANVARLAGEYEAKAIKADAAVVKAQADFRAADQAETSARSAFWKAGSVTSKLGRLRAELGKYEERVRELEKELERLPRRRQAEKERRAEAKREELMDEHTAAARALLDGFTFEVSR